MASIKTELIPPNVACNRTKDTHRQLHDDDKPDLEIQEVVIGACRQEKTLDSIGNAIPLYGFKECYLK